MTISTVPLQQQANQALDFALPNGKTAYITLNDRDEDGFYISIAIDDKVLITNRRVLDRTPIIRKSYFSFPGDFCFIDTMGDLDPVWYGLNTRFVLVYNDDAPLDPKVSEEGASNSGSGGGGGNTPGFTDKLVYNIQTGSEEGDTYSAPLGLPSAIPEGGAHPFTYSLNNAPNGMSINPLTGEISWDFVNALAALGNPPQQIKGTMSVTLTDDIGRTINSADMQYEADSKYSPFRGSIDYGYNQGSNQSFSWFYPNGNPAPDRINGGLKPYKWSLKNAPPKMTIDADNGDLSWDYENATDEGNSLEGKVTIIVTSSDDETIEKDYPYNLTNKSAVEIGSYDGTSYNPADYDDWGAGSDGVIEDKTITKACFACTEGNRLVVTWTNNNGSHNDTYIIPKDGYVYYHLNSSTYGDNQEVDINYLISAGPNYSSSKNIDSDSSHVNYNHHTTPWRSGQYPSQLYLYTK